MIRFKFSGLTAVVALTAASVLTGCIDNAYDLSDIDTTSEIKFNDLTLPINLDPVVLSDIITLDNSDDDKVKEVTINGNTFFALEESGTFCSDSLRIAPFVVNPSTLYPSSGEFRRISASRPQRSRAKAQMLNYSLTSPVNKQLNYTARDIDKAIHSVTAIKFDEMTMEFLISISGFEGSNMSISNIVLKLPQGLSVVPAQGQSYDAATGNMEVNKVNLDAQGRGSIAIKANGVDLKASGANIDYASHSFVLDSQFSIIAGTLEVTPASASQMPESIRFTVDYRLGRLDARSIDGEIEYDLEGQGLNIDPVQITGLPGFLSDKATNLILHNPQIYINVNNPLGADALYCQSGLRLIAERADAPSQAFTLNSFRIGSERGAGPYNFCLSPLAPSVVPDEYAAGLQHVEFASLSHVLSGNGLPDALDIELISPKVPLQKVTGFALGRHLPAMRGAYRLLAPLALAGDATQGSVIYYTDRKDGWNDEDIDAMNITTLKVDADVTSTIPLNAILTAYPLDKQGHAINGVSVAGGNLPAGCTDHHIQLTITGPISHLDGVDFTAEVRPDGSGQTLAPSQQITLKNIRITVGGSYIKKF